MGVRLHPLAGHRFVNFNLIFCKIPFFQTSVLLTGVKLHPKAAKYLENFLPVSCKCSKISYLHPLAGLLLMNGLLMGVDSDKRLHLQDSLHPLADRIL